MEHFLSRVGEKLSRFILEPFVLHIVFIVVLDPLKTPLLVLTGVKGVGLCGVLNSAMRVKMVGS